MHSSPLNAKRKLFSLDDMCVFRKNLDLSTRQTLTLAQNLRQASGSRHVIESYAKQKIYNENHQLDEFFHCDQILFFEEDKKKNTSRNFYECAIVTNDIKGLIDKILVERQLDKDNVLIRIGLDGGGGFMKVCMSIFELESPVSTSRKLVKKFKNSSVKKVFIIGITPAIQENLH